MTKALNKLLKTQFLVACFGTIFAFTAVFFDFKRFYLIEQTIFKVKDCAIPNPVATPCFYGAFGFLLAAIWSYYILRRSVKSRTAVVSASHFDTVKKQQKYFVAFAAFGTAFAWANMTLEFIRTNQAAGQPHVGCSGATVTNPFLTPCFGGSVIFLTLLVVSILTYNKLNKNASQA
jgi:hypothetical protein